MKHKQAGFTIVELMLFLGITIMIAISVVKAYQATDVDVKVKQTYQLLDVIFQQGKRVTAQRNDFQIQLDGFPPTDMSSSLLIGSISANRQAVQSLYPSSSLVTSTQIFHPFGGEVLVSTESSANNHKDIMAIKMVDVPQKACLNLLQRFSAYGLYDMWVESGGGKQLVALYPEATADSAGRNNVNVSKANQLCNRANKSNIYFRLLKYIDFASMRNSSYGHLLSAQEEAKIKPLFDRQKAAMNARENAQIAIQ